MSVLLTEAAHLIVMQRFGIGRDEVQILNLYTELYAWHGSCIMSVIKYHCQAEKVVFSIGRDCTHEEEIAEKINEVSELEFNLHPGCQAGILTAGLLTRNEHQAF